MIPPRTPSLTPCRPLRVTGHGGPGAFRVVTTCIPTRFFRGPSCLEHVFQQQLKRPGIAEIFPRLAFHHTAVAQHNHTIGQPASLPQAMGNRDDGVFFANLAGALRCSWRNGNRVRRSARRARALRIEHQGPRADIIAVAGLRTVLSPRHAAGHALPPKVRRPQHSFDVGGRITLGYAEYAVQRQCEILFNRTRQHVGRLKDHSHAASQLRHRLLVAVGIDPAVPDAGCERSLPCGTPENTRSSDLAIAAMSSCRSRRVQSRPSGIGWGWKGQLRAPRLGRRTSPSARQSR